MKNKEEIIDMLENHIDNVKLRDRLFGKKLIINLDDGRKLSISDGEYDDLSCIDLYNRDGHRVGNLARLDYERKSK